MHTLKDHVSGNSHFTVYRDKCFWYTTDNTNLLFPVPLVDIEDTSLTNEYRSIYLMKWIRNQLDIIKLG